MEKDLGFAGGDLCEGRSSQRKFFLTEEEKVVVLVSLSELQ